MKLCCTQFGTKLGYKSSVQFSLARRVKLGRLLIDQGVRERPGKSKRILGEVALLNPD